MRPASSWRRKPVAFFRPRIVASRSSGLPMTLTKILAWRRSPLTSTWVMLAKPTRGSLTRVRSRSLTSTAICSPNFSCLCGFGIPLPSKQRYGSLCSWFHFFLGKCLDHIADLEVGEVFEQDAAFVAAQHLAHIFLATP